MNDVQVIIEGKIVEREKMKRAVVIEANGTIRRANVDYDEIKREIGGWLEGLDLRDTRQYSFINEDGISLGLPRNDVATVLCFKNNIGLRPDDYIKGNIVIVGPIDSDGDFTDVSEEFALELGV